MVDLDTEIEEEIYNHNNNNKTIDEVTPKSKSLFHQWLKDVVLEFLKEEWECFLKSILLGVPLLIAVFGTIFLLIVTVFWLTSINPILAFVFLILLLIVAVSIDSYMKYKKRY